MGRWVDALAGTRWVAGIALLLLASLSPVAGVALPGAYSGKTSCEPTPSDMEGPFYLPGAPERRATGEGLAVSGRLLSSAGCRPLPGGRIEWWHAAPSGEYDDAHRGTTKSGGEGEYRFSTDPPGKYPGRPLHIHLKASAPGHRPLTTQLYLKGGESRVGLDLVLEPVRR